MVPARRVLHAIEILIEFVDVLGPVLISLGGKTVDWWVSRINRGFDEGNTDIILQD